MDPTCLSVSPILCAHFKELNGVLAFRRVTVRELEWPGGGNLEARDTRIAGRCGRRAHHGPPTCYLPREPLVQSAWLLVNYRHCIHDSGSVFECLEW